MAKRSIFVMMTLCGFHGLGIVTLIPVMVKKVVMDEGYIMSEVKTKI